MAKLTTQNPTRFNVEHVISRTTYFNISSYLGEEVALSLVLRPTSSEPSSSKTIGGIGHDDSPSSSRKRTGLPTTDAIFMQSELSLDTG